MVTILKITKTYFGALAMVVMLGLSPVIYAGSLQPSAAPASTMKTLDEVEPRIPISSVPHTIDTPGSYYLTGNLAADVDVNGITINADSVTLDLMGFSLIGPESGTGYGIYINDKDNIEIRNGTIAGFGGDGISCGLFGGSVYRIIGLRVGSNLGAGINFTGRLHLVRDCVVSNNTEDGIRVHSESKVENNTCEGNGNGQIQDGAGIHVTSSGNMIEGNQVLGNKRGLDVDAGNNIIRGNVVKESTTNYDIASGNQLSILLCQVPETISSPGLVEFAGDLSVSDIFANGLTVEANNVTIDLKGFELVGPNSGTGHGIYMDGRSNVEIRNGTVRDFNYGIFEESFFGKNHRVINARTISNSVCGIYLNSSYSRGHLVKDCTASENGTLASVDVYGIYSGNGSTVTGNRASDNGESATGSYVYGIYVNSGSTVTGNTSHVNGRSASGIVYGIRTGFGNTVIGNTATWNGEFAGGAVYGIFLSGNNYVDQNTSYWNGGGGINACASCTFGTNHAP